MSWHMFSFCNHRCMFPSLIVSQRCWHWHRVLSCSFWEGDTVPLWHRIYHSNITECLLFSAHKLGRRQPYHPGGHTELLTFPVKSQWDCITHVKPHRPSHFLQDKIWRRRPGCEARIFNVTQTHQSLMILFSHLWALIASQFLTHMWMEVDNLLRAILCSFVVLHWKTVM